MLRRLIHCRFIVIIIIIIIINDVISFIFSLDLIVPSVYILTAN